MKNSLTYETAQKTGTSSSSVCDICPHFCKLSAGQRGLCGARACEEDKIIPQGYGKITSLALDPVEKKPLARFYSGSTVLSLGSYGCNLKCPWCQNASISYANSDNASFEEISPEQIVKTALSLKDRGCIGIAYTYNEPFINYEFLRDCAGEAHKQKLQNVIVSNGMINPGKLEEIAHLIDAANIDLKGFSQEFYDKICGDYKTVCQTIETLICSKNCHTEVTTLVIPGLNDSEDDIENAAAWLASLDVKTPYHISRFFPHFKYTDVKATPIETIYTLAGIARKHLKYVYTGNC